MKPHVKVLQFTHLIAQNILCKTNTYLQNINSSHIFDFIEKGRNFVYVSVWLHAQLFLEDLDLLIIFHFIFIL